MLKKYLKSRFIETLKQANQAKQYDQKWYRYHLAEKLSAALSGAPLSTIPARK